MGEIELRISDRLLERTAYIIIIIVLGVLLVMSYLHNSCDTTQGETTQGEITQSETTQELPAANETTNETAAPVEDSTPPKETCVDNEKNQDETDVDCGGAICHACDDGKDCRVSDDCKSGNCEGRTCVSLSGKVELQDLKVISLKSDSDTAKVSRLEGTIVNGLDKDISIDLEIYAMTSNKEYYLGTLDYDESISGPSSPYGSAFIGKIKSGESLDFDFDSAMLGTTYLFGRSGYYNPGDDFAVEVILIDHNNGDELVKQTIVKRV